MSSLGLTNCTHQNRSREAQLSRVYILDREDDSNKVKSITQSARPLLDKKSLWATNALGSHLRQFDIESRRVLTDVWMTRQRGDAPISSELLSEGDHLYFSRQDGRFEKWDTRTDQTTWTAELTRFSDQKPVYDPLQKLVIVHTVDQKVYGLDAASGEIRWTVVFEETFPPTSILSRYHAFLERRIEDSLVYVGLPNGSVHAISTSDGVVQTRFSPDGPQAVGTFMDIVGDIKVVKDRLFFARSDGNIFCYSLQNGMILWQKQFASLGDFLVTEDEIFAAGLDGSVKSLSPSTGADLWTKNLRQQKFISLYAVNKQVVAQSASGVVWFLDRATGAAGQEIFIPARLAARPVLGEQRLFLISSLSNLYEITLPL